MREFSDRVALVTGAARGQGRAHAVALAERGAVIVAVDACADIDTVPYPQATRDDLLETERLVREAGSHCIPVELDVRDAAGMRETVARTIADHGRLDMCIANAGVVSFGKVWELTDEQWAAMIDVNLTGVFNTLRAVAPAMIDRGAGRIVTVASMGGRSGTPNLGHYSAAKWGVIGLSKSLALETALSGVTVNVVCPGTVSTDMVHNPAMYSLFAPDIDLPTTDEVEPRYAGLNPMRAAWSDPADVTAAVLYLVSDQARHVTGTTLEIGAGVSARMP